MENQINVTDKQEVIADIKAKSETFMYSFLKKPGLKIWQLNMTTGVIEEFDKKKANVVMTLDGPDRGKVVEKEFHLHCQALNIKNAKKHFMKMLSTANG